MNKNMLCYSLSSFPSSSPFPLFLSPHSLRAPCFTFFSLSIPPCFFQRSSSSPSLLVSSQVHILLFIPFFTVVVLELEQLGMSLLLNDRTTRNANNSLLQSIPIFLHVSRLHTPLLPPNILRPLCNYHQLPPLLSLLCNHHNKVVLHSRLMVLIEATGPTLPVRQFLSL